MGFDSLFEPPIVSPSLKTWFFMTLFRFISSVTLFFERGLHSLYSQYLEAHMVSFYLFLQFTKVYVSPSSTYIWYSARLGMTENALHAFTSILSAEPK